MIADWIWIGVILFAVGAAAGFVDAIAGGGGLLALPTLSLTGLPPHLALGTNKGQGVFGTAMSLRRYFTSGLLDRRRAAQSFVPALIGAWLGVMLVTRISAGVLTPLIMALLAAVAIFMIVQKPPHPRPGPTHRSPLLAMGVAFALAWYDGFFGPGTGTFLIVLYAILWHDSLDAASANAKVVNFASNLAAMATFAVKGMIVWKLALPMAVGQAIGGYAGAHVTIRVGRGLVRVVVVVVSLALVVRLAANLWWR